MMMMMMLLMVMPGGRWGRDGNVSLRTAERDAVEQLAAALGHVAVSPPRDGPS